MILYGNNGHVYGKVGTSIRFGVNNVEPSMNIITAGWTIRTTGNNRVVATMDPAGGTSKIIYETVTQLDDLLYPLQGGFVSSFRGSEVWNNDQFAAFAPSAGIYNSVWTNASDYYNNHGAIYCNFGSTNTGMITDVYTMDFFNQQKEVRRRLESRCCARRHRTS